jgi:hypothetical protein
MGEFWRKLRRIGRRDELADRLNEELQFHIDMKGGGVGNRVRILEEAHDIWSFGRLEQAILDLRYAARALARSRGFFVLAAIGTALGVAALTAVVSVSDTVLVRSMPYRDSGRLVVVSDQLLKLDLPRFPIRIANSWTIARRIISLRTSRRSSPGPSRSRAAIVPNGSPA